MRGGKNGIRRSLLAKRLPGKKSHPAAAAKEKSQTGSEMEKEDDEGGDKVLHSRASSCVIQ